MNSDHVHSSDEKYKKRTAYVWKVFWFFVDLVGVSLIIAIITYFIINYILNTIFPMTRTINSFGAISIAIVTFICASLISYRHCDKYRNNPFFANQQNNLKTRIDMLFLMTIVSLAIPPLFILFTSEDYAFFVFPIISFAILYNIVWFYYYYKPIDFYNTSEGVFKNSVDIKLTLKQLYHIIVIFNYIVQLVFLSITYNAKYSFFLLLATNAIFYLISLAYTRRERSIVQKAIEENTGFLNDLIIFKKRFVILVMSLAFSVLVQIPILFIVTNLNNITNVIMSSSILLIFLAVYIKSRFYLYFHYNSVLTGISDNDESKEKIEGKDVVYKKYNSLLSGIFVGITTLFSFVANTPLLILVIAPFLYALSYFEEKKKFCRNKENRFVNLGNSLAVLAAISFGILGIFTWNIQVIVFLLSLYFILEIYLKLAYFNKEDVRVIQNIIAVLTFFLIVYAFYPLILSQTYIPTGNPFQIILIHVVLNGIFIVATLLFSLYILFSRVLKDQRSNVFNISVIISFLIIEFFVFTLLNSRAFFIGDNVLFFNGIVISIIAYPAIFFLFLFWNYVFGVFKSETFSKYCYYLFWIQIPAIVIPFFIIFFNSFSNILIFGVIIDCLLLSLMLHAQLKFGHSIEKIKNSTLTSFISYNSYALFVELIILSFTFFNIVLSVFFPLLPFALNILLSSYFSLVIISVLINFLFSMDILFSKAICIKINTFTLTFTALIGAYFADIPFLGTYYVLVVPATVFCVLIYLPILYLLRVEVKISSMNGALFYNSIILSFFIFLVPFIVANNLLQVGFILEPFFITNILNCSLYLLLGLLSFIYLVGLKVKVKENYLDLYNKIQLLILFVLGGTTFFFYPYCLLFGTFYGTLVPLICASCYLFVPCYISYKQEYFSAKLVKDLIILNSLVISCLIISIPTFVNMELVRLGIPVELILIITATLLLTFVFLKYLEYLSDKLELKELIVIYLKIVQILVWLVITVLISLSIYMLLSSFNLSLTFVLSTILIILLILNVYNTEQIENLQFLLFKNKESKYDYKKVDKVGDYYKSSIFLGIIISISLLFTSLIQASIQPLYIFPEFELLADILFTGIFFGFVFGILIVNFLKDFFSKPGWKTLISRLSAGIALFSWLWVKITICVLIAIFPTSYSMLYRISLVCMAFSALTLVSAYIYNRIRSFEEKNLLVKKYLIVLFMISSMIFYIEVFLNFTLNVPYFSNNIFALVVLLSCNLYLLLRRYLAELKYFDTGYFRTFTILSLAGLFYYSPEISLLPLILIGYSLILYLGRSKYALNRFLCYGALSTITFIDIISILEKYFAITSNVTIPLGFYGVVYLACLILVITCSIIYNTKQNNDVDKIILYNILSIWAFVFIDTYTNILLLYNITIYLLVFCFFAGITLYRQKDERYKWLINPFKLLAIFDVTSYISYQFLFINPNNSLINPILTFTLTLGITALAYVYLFRELPEKLRQRTFFPALISIILSFPTFIGFLLFSLGLEWSIALIIALNVGIFVFYLSVGIYQWKLSWAIWKTGYLMWNLFPIVNFAVVYRIFAGVDLFTSALNVFGGQISGSLIISLTICLLTILPVLNTALKEHFWESLMVIWAFTLALIYWVCFNLFIGNMVLTIFSFLLFSIVLLFPILYKIGYWRITSIIWLVLTGFNASFFLFLLLSLSIPLEIIASICTIIVSLFFMVYSYFPNIKNKNTILVYSYIGLLGGLIMLVYFAVFNLISILPILLYSKISISINISLIIFGFSMFSSNYLRFKKESIKAYIHFVIALVLIVNFSWLTLNTFSLFPGYLLFALFFAIAVLGGSFFVFNHYEMLIKPVNKAIPWLTMAFGTSSALTSLSFSFYPGALLTNWAIFIAVNIVFCYYLLDKYGYFLWYFIPIPATFILLDVLLSIEIVRSVSVLAGLIIYLAFFQFSINLFKNYGKSKRFRKIMKFFENENSIKIHNLVCFTVNSAFISLLVLFISPITLEYKTLLALITWSVLTLLSLNYVDSSKVDLKSVKISAFLKEISSYILFSLYLEISIAVFFLGGQFLGLIEGIILSLISLFTLTLLDIHQIKKVPLKWLYPINTGVYITISFIVFAFFNQLLQISLDFMWLNLSILLAMQFYTIYAVSQTLSQFNRFISEKSIKIKVIVQNILFNIIFVIICIYGSSLITSTVINANGLLIGLPATFLNIMLFLLFMFLLNNLVNRKIDVNLRYSILFVLFVGFQVFFAAFWITTLYLHVLVNIFSVFLIVLIESIFSFYPFYSLNLALANEKSSKLKTLAYNIIIFLIYLEISFLFYGLSNLVLGFVESFLISQVVLFFITLLDVHGLKRLKESHMKFVHLISYINISWSLFVVIFQFIGIYPILLGLDVFLFISMQFYTNQMYYSALSSNNKAPNYDENRAKALLKGKYKRQQVLGVLFYITLMFTVDYALYLININWILILLTGSLVLHILMKLDPYIFKLGRISNVAEVWSWGFLMIFTLSYLIWSFVVIFNTAILPVIPLIILIFILELAYFINTVKYLNLIVKNKAKIKIFLLLVLYINFIVWPLCFTTLDPFLFLNLVLFSSGILIIVTFVDEYLEVFGEKRRNLLRRASFLIIGILVSLDIFAFLQLYVQPTVPSFTFGLNLSIACSILLVFLGVMINPFKQRHVVAFAFWMIVSIMLSFVVVFALFSNPMLFILPSFLSWTFSFLTLMILFPFLFMLEELRAWFSKIIDSILRVLQNFKLAIVNFFRKIKRALIKAYDKIVLFFKKNFKYIWLIVSSILSIAVYVLLSMFLNLIWFHALPISLIVFSLLSFVVSPARSDDPEMRFKWNIIYLTLIWGSMTATIFVFLSYIPLGAVPLLIYNLSLLVILLICIIIFGAIILIVIYREEKKGKLSIKWRYYVTLFFIVVIIITIIIGALLGFNFYQMITTP